jgi:transcriptional regulator with XRE-family HTH domain
LYESKGVTGRQIKATRALLGWSQDELARASQVSIATIVHVEGAASNGKPLSKKVGKLRHAIELAGIEFIEEIGVRLRELDKPGS